MLLDVRRTVPRLDEQSIVITEGRCVGSQAPTHSDMAAPRTSMVESSSGIEKVRHDSRIIPLPMLPDTSIYVRTKIML